MPEVDDLDWMTLNGLISASKFRGQNITRSIGPDMQSFLIQPNQEVLKAYWQQACGELGIEVGTTFDHFRFGDSPGLANDLADLVSDGEKRATAGLVAEMELDGEKPPKCGDYWIVTDGAGKPRLIIQSRMVHTAPFRTVDEGFAWDEGEGDRSLTWWRDAHVDYFQRSCQRIGIAWTEDLDVVFERFDVLWPRQAAERLIVRCPYADAEWNAYHSLRRTALFERYLPDLAYDPDYADNWRSDVFHLALLSAGNLLGCMQIRLTSALEASLQLVAIKEGMRGRGFGRLMLAEGEAFARCNGRQVLRVFGEPESESFYRKLGFEDGPEWDAVPASQAAKPLKKTLAQARTQ